VLVGALQERLHTRELGRMSGLWETVPRLGGAGLFFALASMGLPGLGDFVGEFMILLGVYQESRILTAVAAVGILASTFYALKFVQYVFHGPNNQDWTLPDLVVREAIIVTPMIVILLWLGLYPQPVFHTFNPAMETLQQHAGQTMQALRR
jgi:NADH-quinone oxidoreductase subunit M